MGKHACIAVVILTFFFVLPFGGAQIEVGRSPVNVQVHPGDAVGMRLSVTVSGVQQGVIVTESLPHGWGISGSPDKTIGDEIKWFLSGKDGVGDTEISYTIHVPASAQGSYQMGGYWTSVDENGQLHGGESDAGVIHVLAVQGSGNVGGGGSGSDNPARQAPESLSMICTPGKRICDQGTVIVCLEDGMEFDVEEKCEFGCEEGRCIVPLQIPEPGKLPPPEESIDITGRVLEDGTPAYMGIAALIIVLVLSVIVMKRSRKKPSEVFRYEYQPPEQ